MAFSALSNSNFLKACVTFGAEKTCRRGSYVSFLEMSTEGLDVAKVESSRSDLDGDAIMFSHLYSLYVRKSQKGDDYSESVDFGVGCEDMTGLFFFLSGGMG